MKTVTLSVLALVSVAPLRADVKLPAIFSDHMVVQNSAAVPVWGWAEPGEKVTVTLAGQSKSTQADADGKWMVKLDSLKPASEAQTLTVAGKNSLAVKDVLIGEVWLASGQSNMAMLVQNARNFDEEKAHANLPQIRMFIAERNSQPEPQADFKGQWKVCTPDEVGRFSATAFFFGRDLLDSLHTPVGLINSSWGGTAIEAWTSREAQNTKPELAPMLENWKKADAQAWDAANADAAFQEARSKWLEADRQAKAENKAVPRPPQKRVASSMQQNHPANLFNGMIAPLIPYAIRGAIWYQGEANTPPGRVELYATQLPLLIQDWRSRWGDDFPFAWVQLPGLESKPTMRDWPHMREAMLKTLAVKNTGMAITIDIGEANNIHPKDKQDVGHRLALWALGTVYGKPGPTSGPLPAGHAVRDHAVVVKFNHADGGLSAKGGDLTGFVIAGADRKWVPAGARIEGDTVVVSSPNVPEPVAVRYAWENNPVCNLFNGAGLPASPFRTDDWN